MPPGGSGLLWCGVFPSSCMCHTPTSSTLPASPPPQHLFLFGSLFLQGWGWNPRLEALCPDRVSDSATPATVSSTLDHKYASNTMLNF